jgi:hypothetical protein
MNIEKMNQLRELISEMSITEVMHVVNEDDRVLLLNWFYADHIAKLWDTKVEVIEPQMEEIKYMFEKVVNSGGINLAYEVEDQKDYLDEWNISI